MGSWRIRAVAALSVAALALPADAGAAADAGRWPVNPICTGQAMSPDGVTMSLYVEIAAVPPPVPPEPHRASCRVYVNGWLVGTVEGDHVGVVIVGAGVFHNLPLGGYTFCVEFDNAQCPG